MQPRMNFFENLSESLPKNNFEHYRLFIIHHLYSDTLEFILALKKLGVIIDTVIGISYSNQPNILERLREVGLRVVTPSSSEMEVEVAKELRRCLALCQKNGQKLIIHEVGGYAIPLALSDDFSREREFIAGGVEDTKQGKWRVEKFNNIPFPYIHCAESRLKQVESPFVGDAVVFAVDDILRRHGYALAGRNAFVLGYGWIGQAVCESFRRKNVIVSCFDTDPIKRLSAQLNGFEVVTPNEISSNNSIIIGATGKTSITRELLEQLNDNTFVGSASSRNIEIDLSELKNITVDKRKIDDEIEECWTGDSKRLYLLNNGYPVNFLKASIPDEISYLILGDVFLIINKLINTSISSGIHSVDENVEREVSECWLRSV